MTITSTSEQPKDSCEFSEFGCCPDGVTAATRINLEGCIGVDFDNCTFSENENNTGKKNIVNNNEEIYEHDDNMIYLHSSTQKMGNKMKLNSLVDHQF